MESLLALSAHQSPSTSLHCTSSPSPLNLGSLHPYLSRHPDPQFALYVFLGLRDCFRIGFSHSSPLHSSTHNHPSSGDNPNAVVEHFSEELRLSRIVGPVHQSLLGQVQVSPLGLISKRHSDKWCMIMDFSAPRGRSVNDGISPSLCSLRYTSVDNAVDIIMKLGQSTELVKMGLSNVYCMVPVHPCKTTKQPSRFLTGSGRVVVIYMFHAEYK